MGLKGRFEVVFRMKERRKERASAGVSVSEGEGEDKGDGDGKSTSGDKGEGEGGGSAWGICESMDGGRTIDCEDMNPIPNPQPKSNPNHNQKRHTDTYCSSSLGRGHHLLLQEGVAIRRTVTSNDRKATLIIYLYGYLDPLSVTAV